MDFELRDRMRSDATLHHAADEEDDRTVLDERRAQGFGDRGDHLGKIDMGVKGRSGWPSGRFQLFFPRLGELLDDHVAFQAGQMVDEQHAVKMVDLVLEAGREKARRSPPRGACPRGRASGRVSVSGRSTLGKLIGNREAALGIRHVLIGGLQKSPGLIKTRGSLMTGSLPLPPAAPGGRSPGGARERRPGPRQGRCPARRTSSRTYRRQGCFSPASTRLDGLGDLAQDAGPGTSKMRTNGHGCDLVFQACRFKRSAGARAVPAPSVPSSR